MDAGIASGVEEAPEAGIAHGDAARDRGCHRVELMKQQNADDRHEDDRRDVGEGRRIAVIRRVETIEKLMSQADIESDEA